MMVRQNLPHIVVPVLVLIALGVLLIFFGPSPWDGIGQALLSGGLVGGVFAMVGNRLEVRGEIARQRENLRQLLLVTENLIGIDLSGQQLPELYLPARRLTNANLEDADISGSQLYFADLELARLRGVRAQQSDLGGSNLKALDARFADLTGAKVDDCDLEGSDLSRASLVEASFVRSNMAGCRLVGADLKGAILRRASLSGADLWEADLQDADLTGISYDEETRWPQGFVPPAAQPAPPPWDPATDLRAWLVVRNDRTRDDGAEDASDFQP